jgi:hypothetical protein
VKNDFPQKQIISENHLAGFRRHLEGGGLKGVLRNAFTKMETPFGLYPVIR